MEDLFNRFECWPSRFVSGRSACFLPCSVCLRLLPLRVEVTAAAVAAAAAAASASLEVSWPDDGGDFCTLVKSA